MTGTRSYGWLIGAAILAIATALIVWKMMSGGSAVRDVPATGPRLVALSPAIAVILRDLGVADRIVGRHAFDLVLDRSIPSCGDQAGIDYEALITTRPTHVLLEWGSRPLPERLTQLAQNNGWTLRSYPLLSLADIVACAGAVAEESGAEPARASELLDRMDAAWSLRTTDLTRAGRVLLLGAVAPPSALGPGSFHHQILARIGGTPAITEGAPYITLDAEDVLRLAPDAIILILPRAPGTPASTHGSSGVIRLLGRVGTLDIPAVKTGRVALIDDPLAHTPSTAMIALADEMARILGAWAE